MFAPDHLMRHNDDSENHNVLITAQLKFSNSSKTPLVIAFDVVVTRVCILLELFEVTYLSIEFPSRTDAQMWLVHGGGLVGRLY